MFMINVCLSLQLMVPVFSPVVQLGIYGGTQIKRGVLLTYMCTQELLNGCTKQ